MDHLQVVQPPELLGSGQIHPCDLGIAVEQGAGHLSRIADGQEEAQGNVQFCGQLQPER